MPPDLVFFLADEEARCVRGESWASLAPHLAAPHSAARLDVSRLAAAAGLLPAEVEAALAALAAQGLLAASDEVPVPDRPPVGADCGASRVRHLAHGPDGSARHGGEVLPAPTGRLGAHGPAEPAPSGAQGLPPPAGHRGTHGPAERSTPSGTDGLPPPAGHRGTHGPAERSTPSGTDGLPPPAGHRGTYGPAERSTPSGTDGLPPPAGRLGADRAEAGASAVRVVAVGDYLDPRTAAQAATGPPGTAWLPVKAGGASVWLGPLFGAGGLACPACLRLALARSRPVAALYYHLCAEPVAPSAPTPARAAWVAEEISRRLADGSLRDTLWVLDPATGEGVAHRVRREVECPACGTAPERSGCRPASEPSHESIATSPSSSPPKLPVPPPSSNGRDASPRPHRRTRLSVHPVDGGYRVESPAATRRRLERLVDPLTGSVREVRPSDHGVPHAPCVAVATYPHPLPPATWAQLRARPRVAAAGKGSSADQAVVGAMAEAIERASGVFRGDEPRRTATWEELGDGAIPPPALLLYSRRQLERGEGPAPQWSPRALTEWSSVTALTGGRRRWMPTALAYYAYTPPAGAWDQAADSNGCAAGSTWEDAVLQGLLELVERDAVATWWYNGLPRPRLDERLDGELGRRAAAVRSLCRRRGSELFLLDLTGDLALPVVAALALPAAGTGSLRLGFGAHLEAPLAAARALCELAQFLPLADGGVACDRRAAARVPPWLETACRAAPAAALPRGRPCTDFSAALGHVSDRLAAAGLDAWVLDQTRDPEALTVVRVVVPGLRPWTRRLAPGRLYDVPVAMGWLAAARTETEMETLPLYS